MTYTTIRSCKNESCRHIRFEELDCMLKEIDIGEHGECSSFDAAEGGKI